MPLATQFKLGPYEVISLIGQGAIGEVYRARDPRLRRDVAIKILDATNRGDEESIRRFEREARAASALNHPNIVTIHDVGREDQLSYIVTELVEGESLRAYLLRNGPLPIREVLEIGIQLAEGLAAAHDEGLIHRDLKPENIMVTAHGRVKILDFGLAKPAEEQGFSENATIGVNDTAPGVIFGTAAYMSPEQAKGGRVRFYADQFSLGVILYEMAAGVHPFKRDTALQTLSSILSEDPPPLSQGSAPFQWLVRRCLHREPDHRYASTHDVSRELQNVLAHLTDALHPPMEIDEAELSVPPTEPAVLTGDRPPGNANWVRSALWLTAVGLAIAVGYLFSNWLHRPDTQWANARFLPLATGSALEVFPAWSPNARSVAYSADTDGVFQILVRSNEASMPAQLTRLPDDCLYSFWSPDGARIYFISDKALWSVGATGGTPEKILNNVVQAAVAPDGRTIAALRADRSAFRLWSGSLDGAKFSPYDKGSLSNIRVMPWSYLRFSQDGKKLGAWLSLANGRSEFWVIPFPEGEPKRQLSNLESQSAAREFTWLPSGREIVYSERRSLSAGYHLRKADLLTDRITTMTAGSGSEQSPSIATNGRELAFSTSRMDYDVVRYWLDGRIEESIASPLFESAPAMSAAGHFAYVTDRSGHPEIWLKESSGSWERPLVTSESFGEDTTNFLSDTVFSPDGKRIAYTRSGVRDEAVWISTVNGDPPVRLTQRGETLQRGPSWSPDGNSIVYFSMRNGSYVIMRARVGAMDEPMTLAENAGIHPRWSPRGDWIASAGTQKGIVLLSPDGKQKKDMGSGLWLTHGWTVEGSALLGIRAADAGRMELVRLDPASGTEHVLADLGNLPAAYKHGMAVGAMPFHGLAIAPDGKSFFTSVIRSSSDVWVMDRTTR
jgi:eukaryotic-like serine/threonine-protein kinase